MAYDVAHALSLGADVLLTHMTRLETECFGHDPNKRRGIVFFNNKDTLHAMAQAARGANVNVFPYHGISREDYHAGDDEYTRHQLARQQVMDLFQEMSKDPTASKWLFATSAGGGGIDLMGVSGVIIFGWWYGQMELAQMFGRCRAPHDDTDARCVGLVLTSPADIAQLDARIKQEEQAALAYHDTPEDKAVRQEDMKAHARFLKAGDSPSGQRTDCIRLELENDTTGVPISCMVAGAHLCGVCSRVLASEDEALQRETPAPFPTASAPVPSSWFSGGTSGQEGQPFPPPSGNPRPQQQQQQQPQQPQQQPPPPQMKTAQESTPGPDLLAGHGGGGGGMELHPPPQPPNPQKTMTAQQPPASGPPISM